VSNTLADGVVLAHLLGLICVESAGCEVGCGEDWWCDLVWLVEPDGAGDCKGVLVGMSIGGSVVHRP
jgi:hypothetical protein